MGAVQLELDQDLVDLLEELHRPVKQVTRELIVKELYRQGEISIAPSTAVFRECRVLGRSVGTLTFLRKPAGLRLAPAARVQHVRGFNELTSA